MKKSVYNFLVFDCQGKEISLERYRGKVLLIVNTASKGPGKRTLRKLQKVYDQFKERPFVVLAFPCAQFLNLEHSSASRILYVYRRLGVTFPVFSRVNVNGDSELSLFRWLKKRRPGKTGRRIEWNFTKFLVESDGRTVHRYGPADRWGPMVRMIDMAVERCENNDFPPPFDFTMSAQQCGESCEEESECDGIDLSESSMSAQLFCESDTSESEKSFSFMIDSSEVW